MTRITQNLFISNQKPNSEVAVIDWWAKFHPGLPKVHQWSSTGFAPPLPPFRTWNRGWQKPVGLSNYSIIILIISKSIWKSYIYLKILQKSSKTTLKLAKILSKSMFFICFPRNVIEIRTKIRILLLKIWLSLNRGAITKRGAKTRGTPQILLYPFPQCSLHSEFGGTQNQAICISDKTCTEKHRILRTKIRALCFNPLPLEFQLFLRFSLLVPDLRSF